MGIFCNFGMRKVFSRWSQFVYDSVKEHSKVIAGNIHGICMCSSSLCVYTNFISSTYFDEVLLFFLTFVLFFLKNFKMLRFENKYVNPKPLGFLDSWLCTRSFLVEEEINFKWDQTWVCE